MDASLLPRFFSTRYLILQLETTNFHRTSCSLVIQTLVLLLEVRSIEICYGPCLSQKNKLDRKSFSFLNITRTEYHRNPLGCEFSNQELVMKPLFVPACVFTDVCHKRIWRITCKYVFFFPTALVIHDYVILSPKKIFMLKNTFVLCTSWLLVPLESINHVSCFMDLDAAYFYLGKTFELSSQ